MTYPLKLINLAIIASIGVCRGDILKTPVLLKFQCNFNMKESPFMDPSTTSMTMKDYCYDEDDKVQPFMVNRDSLKKKNVKHSKGTLKIYYSPYGPDYNGVNFDKVIKVADVDFEQGICCFH